MTITLYIILGLIIGGLVAWFFAKSRFQGIHSKQIADLQMNFSNQLAETEGKAKYAEAQVNELRQQVQQKDSDINQMRGELDVERELKARLEESQKHLQEGIERFKEMESKLSETFKSLSFDALTKNSDEFKKYADDFMKLAEEKLKTQTIEGKKRT